MHDVRIITNQMNINRLLLKLYNLYISTFTLCSKVKKIMNKAKIVRKSKQENKLDDENETGVERDRKKDKRKTST